jgi:hypothetical protein
MAAPKPVRPEDHWFSQGPDATEPSHEQIISATRAVEEALARLGPRATSAQVQQNLKEMGLDVSLALIDRIRGEIRH